MGKWVPILLGGVVVVGLVGAAALGFMRFFSGEDDWVCSNGEWVRHGSPIAPKPTGGCGSATKLTPTPKQSTTPTPTAVSEKNIQVESPVAGTVTKGQSVLLKGRARVFENTFNWRVKDKDGTVLGEGTVVASAPDAGQWGTFSTTVNFKKPSGTRGAIEVFDYSAKDGSVIDLNVIPVVFEG